MADLKDLLKADLAMEQCLRIDALRDALRELIGCLDTISVAMTPDVNRTIEALRVAKRLIPPPAEEKRT